MFEHISLAGVALALGILLALPLGLILERQRVIAEPLIRLISMTQTIPSIALLAFMIPLFGVGHTPSSHGVMGVTPYFQFSAIPTPACEMLHLLQSMPPEH